MTNNKSRESLETVIHSASEKDMRHIRRRARAKNVDTVERERETDTQRYSLFNMETVYSTTHTQYN